MSFGKERFQKLAGIIKEQVEEKKEETKSQNLGLSSPGYYWFKDFDQVRERPWTVVHWDGEDVYFTGSDESDRLFQGSKEEYLSIHSNTRHHRSLGVLGIFVGPLDPPNS